MTNKSANQAEEHEAYVLELKEWRQLVGSAILGFGEIELITLKCLDRLPQDRIYRTTATLPLGKRIDLITEILEQRRADPEVAEFLRNLRRAKELSEFRNLIAHNPLMAVLFKNPANNDLQIEKLIRSARNEEKVIDLPELKERSDEVVQLASELWIAVGKIAQVEIL